MSRIFAYCRISTLDQTTENQRREIESAGFKIKPQQIIEEHISGSAATSERPGFNRLLARLKCGDQLIVTKLDWICPYISRHLLSLNPLLACCRRYSRGER